MSKSKNILIISPFFYPEPISTGKFNTDMVINLVEKGHKVTVLCFHPFYPDWKVKTSNSKLNGVTIIRGGKNLKYSSKTIFRRLTLEFGYAFFVLRKLRKHQRNSDIIIPVFPPSFGFYSIIPFLKKNIKKIGMVHDLQEIYSTNKKGKLNKFMSFIINKIEYKCYNSCDKLIFLSSEMKDVAKKMYKLDSNKLEIQYPFHSIKNSITNDLGGVFDENKTNIVYSGALGEKQNPSELYNFFDYASSQINNTIFYFFSQGNIFDKLKESNKNKKIKFYNLVERENLEELYSRSDVQIIPQLQNTSKGSLPSKLPNLLASGCKVLIITDKASEIENLFKLHSFETVSTSWEKENLLIKLKNIISRESNNVNQIQIAKKIFTIDKMIHKILD